jgi:hypothetical protein
MEYRRPDISPHYSVPLAYVPQPLRASTRPTVPRVVYIKALDLAIGPVLCSQSYHHGFLVTINDAIKQLYQLHNAYKTMDGIRRTNDYALKYFGL